MQSIDFESRAQAKAEERILRCIENGGTTIDFLYLGLSRVPEGLERISNLKSINFVDNRLSKLDGLEKLTDLEELYIGRNNFRLLTGLETLTALRDLNCYGNEISIVQGLDNLKNLEQLSLAQNNLTTIDDLKNLKKLKRLIVDGNRISTLSNLEGFDSLTHLSATHNELVHLDIQNTIGTLESLDIRGNGYKELNIITTFPQLKSLSAGENQLTALHCWELPDTLEVISLYNNQIKTIESLSLLTSLRILHLRGNGITSIHNWEPCPSLTQLDLSNNPIAPFSKETAKSILDWIQNSNLQKLEITGCRFIEEMESFNEQDYPTGVKVNNLSIFKRDLQKFLSEEIELIPSGMPQKVVLIGNSKSGKTSLLDFIREKKLADLTAPPQSTDTLNMELVSAKGMGDKRSIYVYDLGGQDYYHGSYNLFLTCDTTYVLVWSKDVNRNKINPIDESTGRVSEYYTFDVPYWLGNITYLMGKQGSNAEVTGHEILLAENKADLQEGYPLEFADPKLDRTLFRESVSFSLANTSTSPLDEAKRQYFQVLFNSVIPERYKDPIHYNKAVDDFLDFKSDQDTSDDLSVAHGYNDYIEGLKKKYSSWKNLPEVDIESIFQRYHNSGWILHYVHHETLKNTIFPNPRIVRSTVARLMDRIEEKHSGAQGQLSAALRIFKDKGFLAIKDLLLHQKIIFEDTISGKKHYIIPQKLPLKPDLDPLYQMLRSKYKPGFSLLFSRFMPVGMMNGLMGTFGQEPNLKKYYRYEMMFTIKKFEANVWMKVDMERLSISFYFSGESRLHEVKRYLFESVIAAYHLNTHQEFSEQFRTSTSEKATQTSIQRATRDESFLQWLTPGDIPSDLYASVDGEFFTKYDELETAIEEDIPRVLSHCVEEIIPYRCYDDPSDQPSSDTLSHKKHAQRKEVFLHQFAPFLKRAPKAPKKVFVSYSHDNWKYVEELQKFLFLPIKSGQIEVWQDGVIKAGEQWDDQIKGALQNADIVILLISQSFIASYYVNEVEIKMALDRVRKGGATLLPVLLEDCDWASWNVADPESVPDENATQSHKIASFEIAPKKDTRLRPINRFEHPNEAWQTVLNQLRSYL